MPNIVKEIEELSKWDMECVEIPDGYNTSSIPDLTRGNMNILMQKINELVEEINKLKGIEHAST